MTGLAYSYTRFSTPDQARGDSLRRQVAAADAWAAEHGLVLDERLTDAGVSAFTGRNRERGAFATFLAAVETGTVPKGSTLIVESLDRISREDVLSALQGLLNLIRAGITVVTLLDKQTYSVESIGREPTKLMMSIGIMMRAHEESATKSDRVSKAWGAKRDRAVATQEAMTRQCVAWCRVAGDAVPGRGRYEVIPDRAQVLKRIFELTAAGYGQRAVASRLNREGVPAWGRGDGWHSSYVTKIIQSRAVLGFFQPHVKPRSNARRTPHGAEISNYYPTVIDEDLYYRALAARAGRKGAGGRRGTAISNLLSGLGKCEACGRNMVHVDKGAAPKGGRYLICDSSLRGLACDQPAKWRYDKAEAIVLNGVRKLDARAIFSGSDPAADARAKAVALASQLAAEERRRDRLIDALGDVTDTVIVATLRNAAEAVTRLQRERAAAERAAELADKDESLDNRLLLVGKLTDRLSKESGQELADLRTRLAQELRRVLRRLRFSPDTILADYRVGADVKKSAWQWVVGVPLVQSADDRRDHAYHAERTSDDKPWGTRRSPPSAG